MSDWAENEAWKVINENRELFDSITKTHAVAIIAAALREAEARERERAIKLIECEIEDCGRVNPVRTAGERIIEAIRAQARESK